MSVKGDKRSNLLLLTKKSDLINIFDINLIIGIFHLQ